MPFSHSGSGFMTWASPFPRRMVTSALTSVIIPTTAGLTRRIMATPSSSGRRSAFRSLAEYRNGQDHSDQHPDETSDSIRKNPRHYFFPTSRLTAWIRLAACGLVTARWIRISVGVTSLP